MYYVGYYGKLGDSEYEYSEITNDYNKADQWVNNAIDKDPSDCKGWQGIESFTLYKEAIKMIDGKPYSNN